jgi:hypothetical protein
VLCYQRDSRVCRFGSEDAAGPAGEDASAPLRAYEYEWGAGLRSITQRDSCLVEPGRSRRPIRRRDLPAGSRLTKTEGLTLNGLPEGSPKVSSFQM